MSICKVILIGNVGGTPNVREVNDTKVAQFNLATTERFKGKDGNVREETEWHNVTVWGKLAEVIEKYVDKGSQLYVEGRLKTEKYSKDGQDRFITRIIANSIQLLGGKRDGDASSSPAPQTERPKSTPLPTVDTDAPDDDLPF
jgi:single-strand DNA-binding protein